MSDDTQLLVSTEEDHDLLDSSGMSWDDLAALKENVGQEIMKLTVRISALIGNKNFVANIPLEHRSRVAVIVGTIMEDLEHYSSKFKKIRMKHEGFSGKFKDLNEYELYNAISMDYMNLTTQMISVLSPLFGELTVLIPNNQEQKTEEGGTTNDQISTH